MATQGLIAVTMDGKVLLKVLTGQDGMFTPEAAQALERHILDHGQGGVMVFIKVFKGDAPFAERHVEWDSVAAAYVGEYLGQGFRVTIDPE